MQLFANNAKTTVSSTLSPSSTSLVVLDASKLPTIDIGDYYLLTLEKADRTALEIVKVTGAVGNTLTIIRAQEGTSSIEFPIDSIAELRLTAEYLNNNTEKLDTIEYGAQVNTVTPDNVVTLTNKTLDSSTNKIGADSIHYKVKNMTGSTILPGTVVKVDGYEAGEETIRITPTTNTNDVAIGITKSSILHGEIGLVVNTGIASGINTTTYTTGTILYQNGSGGLTVTKPSSETYQAVAVAMNSKVDGSLLVEFSEPVKVNWDDRYYTETEINNTLTSYTRSGDTVQLTGDVTGSATVAADGSISVATTISANSVALGTDTTGNYVASLVAGTGIIVGAAGEGATPTITNSAPNVTTDISITHNASTVVVNSSDGDDGTINAATTSLAGAMSAKDKTKLDGIASGAEVNQNAFSSIAVSGQTTVDADSKTDTLTLASGTGIYITTNATTDTITLTNTSPDQVVTLTGSGATSVTGTYPNFTISSTNTTYGLATSTVAGLVELVSDTVQTTAANAVTSTTGRTYGSQLNSAGQLVVNVPWTDTVYTHPTSGVTAGTYKSVTVDANGHVTSGSNPNTLAGYGITDAATSTHTHGDISNTGTITSTAVTPANTDYILISDTSASGAIKRGISIGTSTTTFLRNDGTWQTATANTGTVTSVSLSLPGMFTVSGSPVTTSGTLTAELASQTANTIFAAPSGSAGVPSFRSLVATDIPSLDASKLTTGTLGTARGGTGLTSFTQGGVLYASSTSALASSAAGTAGQVLTSNGTGAPSWTTINAGATISNDTTTNATYYPVFATATTGNLTSAGVSSSKLQYNPSTGTLTATNMDSLSDATLKDNVHGLSYGIQEVMAARPVSYTWKDSEEKSFGFIAQELEEIFPEAVHTTADGLKTVNYPILTAVLFNAVKSLKLELMELKAQNK